MSKTILFFGTDEFSAPALQALIDAGYLVAAVITRPDSKQGRGQKLTAPLVKQIAEKNAIPVWQPTKLSDIAGDIKALGPVSGVLSSYGKIVPQSIIDLFTPGIINIHPSLLPKYRGPSPVETAILNGDSETGVSIMKLSAAMDAGPVYTQEKYPLHGHETAPELREALSRMGSRLLIDALPAILDGASKGISQDENSATYCRLLTKQDAFLDPSTMSAVEADRQVRAYLSFPRTKMTLLGQSVIVTKTHVSEVPTSLLDQRAKDGNFLIIDELIGPSGRQMSAASFLNGYAAGA
ncbi:MAG: methionyl-tRNA formyltransferase [Candidatus Microsaccharimonas sp.]